MNTFSHKVVLEATGPDGDVFQRITFEQFYDDNMDQIKAQARLFGDVADAVKAASLATRDKGFPEVNFDD